MRKKFYHAFKKHKIIFMSPGIYTREIDRSFVMVSGATNSNFIAGIDPAVKSPRIDMLKVFGSAS